MSKVKTHEEDDYTVIVTFSGRIMKEQYLNLHKYAIQNNISDDAAVKLAIFYGVSELESKIF